MALCRSRDSCSSVDEIILLQERRWEVWLSAARSIGFPRGSGTRVSFQLEAGGARWGPRFEETGSFLESPSASD